MNHTAFKHFLTDYDLSVRRFSDFCRSTFISKSTIQRLTKPEDAAEHIQPHYLNRIMPALIQNCQRWMEEIGRPADEINRVLKHVFEEDYETMICERHKLDPEHLEFFGLDRDPFALEADPRSAEEAYTNKELDRIVRRVEDAVKFQGFLCVVGPVGAGKTNLKSRIADKLGRQGKTRIFWPRFAEMGKLNAGGIVHFILEELGLTGRIRLPLAQRQLERQLESLTASGVNFVMGIDEAHRLPDATLTALKNFYELGTGGYEKYLAMVLFGQPSIKQRFEDVNFREIAERVEVVEMPSMAKHAADYIAHRIKLAGGNSERLIAPDAIKAIASQAATPLAIGNLTNKGLITAYKAGERRVLGRFLTKDTEPKVRHLKKVAGGGVANA